jgi:hypothetical protein
MPAGGFPVVLYFHGSGGPHTEVIDASRSPAMGVAGPPGEGPAMHFARIGFGAAATALPANPERVPSTSEISYINFNNLAAFPQYFGQALTEQRLFLSALETLELDPAVLGACGGVALPAGATKVRFDPQQLYVSGQSLGAIFANMVGSVDPRPRAALPTGSGGFWSFMVLQSAKFDGAADALPLVLGTDQPLTFAHPAMSLMEMGWEAGEPLVYLPRLGRRPLPGRPVRPVYEPVGRGDTYFDTTVYDAMALAFGHEEAGDVVWSSMQDALALQGLDGMEAYPVVDNRVSEDGRPSTGVVVQYEGDGLINPHSIYRQRDEVIYQYSCFLSTMRDTGRAVVPAPAPLGTPCPTGP